GVRASHGSQFVWNIEVFTGGSNPTLVDFAASGFGALRGGVAVLLSRCRSANRAVATPPGFAVSPTLVHRADLRSLATGVWRIEQCAKLELAVGEVYVEDGNIVSILIGSIKKGSRRIYVHPVGPLPARRFPADHFEFAGFRLDFENRYTVVAAVRIVEEP